MFQRLLYFGILFVCFSDLNAQEVEVYDDFDDFQKEVLSENNKVYIINYWATWCAPCVKELPYFEKITAENTKKEIEVILVSLDFKNHLDTRLKPFLKENNIKSRVIHLVDTNTTEWIDKVNQSWAGTIPITEFRVNKNKLFHLEEFHSYDELNDMLTFFVTK